LTRPGGSDQVFRPVSETEKIVFRCCGSNELAPSFKKNAMLNFAHASRSAMAQPDKKTVGIRKGESRKVAKAASNRGVQVTGFAPIERWDCFHDSVEPMSDISEISQIERLLLSAPEQSEIGSSGERRRGELDRLAPSGETE
jgi:hypothetical protein